MKVLLINPSSSLVDDSWACRKFFTPIPSLGLAYIASILEKTGYEVSIIDQFADKITDKELLNIVKKDSPQIIGFSALTSVIQNVKKLVTGIREFSRDSKIIVGNLHGTCFPDEVLREGIADIVVRGEGESTMLELCQLFIERESLEGLPGISFKIDGKIIHNPDRGLIDNLDSLPFPAWHLFDLDNYIHHPMLGISGARALPITASRGCPYRCYYCSQDKTYNRVRYRNLNNVVEEIKYFNDIFNINFFGFCDAYFPFNEESGIEFSNLIIRNGLHKKIKWFTETRVDKVTPRLLRAMREAGAHIIMYGIEVGNVEILQSLNKGTTLEEAKIAIKETKKAGILAQGLFMLGLPGETEKSCRDTIKFAKELNCDFVKFNIATPYPGSKFFEDFRKTKIFSKPEILTSWIDWTNQSGNLAYTPKSMNSETLKYLQRMAMMSFYLRPKIILKHMISGTISCENIFYGGLWLLLLYLKNIRKLLYLLRKQRA